MARKDDLTEEEIAEIREAFGMFDVDNDGTISCKELGNCLHSLGLQPKEKEVREMIREVDVDNNGAIDFPEFIMMLQNHWKADDLEDQIRDAFKIFDKDGSGYIESDELRSVMIKLGEHLTTAEIEDMIKVADKNGDGKIDYHEFADFIAAPKK